MSDESIPYDEPEQIVCTGEEGSGVWNPAFGAWEADEFGMDSDQSVGPGERLFVNRRLYDALAAKLAEADAENKRLRQVIDRAGWLAVRRAAHTFIVDALAGRNRRDDCPHE
jgi:hypothetical protein